MQVLQLQAKVGVLKAASLDADQHAEELQQQLAGMHQRLSVSKAACLAREQELHAAEEQLVQARSTAEDHLSRASALQCQLADIQAQQAAAALATAQLSDKLAASLLAASTAEGSKVRFPLQQRFVGACKGPFSS